MLPEKFLIIVIPEVKIKAILLPYDHNYPAIKYARSTKFTILSKSHENNKLYLLNSLLTFLGSKNTSIVINSITKCNHTEKNLKYFDILLSGIDSYMKFLNFYCII